MAASGWKEGPAESWQLVGLDEKLEELLKALHKDSSPNRGNSETSDSRLKVQDKNLNRQTHFPAVFDEET